MPSPSKIWLAVSQRWKGSGVASMAEFLPAVLPTESLTNVGFWSPSFVLDVHQDASATLACSDAQEPRNTCRYVSVPAKPPWCVSAAPCTCLCMRICSDASFLFSNCVCSACKENKSQLYTRALGLASKSCLTGDTNMVLNIATATPVTFSELLQSLPLAGLTPGLEFFWLKSLPFPGWTNIPGLDQRSGLSRTSWSRTTGSHLPSARTGTGQDL